jgi:circadian clock protein KaiC
MGRGGGTAKSRATGVVPTGISGFDELVRGGLPRHKVTLLTGTSGAGKTVFAMQMAATNASAGRHGVYVAFEESPAEILANMGTFDWKASRLRRHLQLVDGDLGADTRVSGTFELCGLIALLDAESRARKASWVVLDGLDQLLGLLADPIAERREIYRLKRWVETSGVACLITAKEDDAGLARDFGQADGLVRFAADCVVRLSLKASRAVVRRALRVVKYRGAAGADGERPMVIGSGGIAVGQVRQAVLPPAARDSGAAIREHAALGRA